MKNAKTFLICKFESGMGRSKYPIAMYNGDIEFVRQKLQEFNKTGKCGERLAFTTFINGEVSGETIGQEWTGDTTDAEIESTIRVLMSVSPRDAAQIGICQSPE